MLSWALDLAGRGVAIVGPVPAGLPSFDVPSASFTEIGRLLPAAVAIFLVSFADEILTARSFAGRHNQHVRAGQELVAMGAADIAAGLTQGFPIGASGSRTTVNDSMGARTQISGGVAAAVVVVILLFLTEPIQYLPKPVLAAVIVSAAIGLIDLDAWRQLARVDPVELTLAAVTMGGVIILGVLNALVIAVGLSIVDVVRRSARPSDAVLGWVRASGATRTYHSIRSARTTPGIVVYRLDDRIFFANARYFTGARPRGDSRRVAARALARLRRRSRHARRLHRPGGIRAAGRRARAGGRPPLPSRASAPTCGNASRRSASTEAIGPENFYPSVRTAVDGCARAMSVRREPAQGIGAQREG